MKTVIEINKNGIFDILGYSKAEINVPENIGVDDIEGKKDDIQLDNNFSISDNNILAVKEKTYQKGENISIKHKKDTYTFNIPNMEYDDSNLLKLLDITYNKLLKLKKVIDYIYNEEELMFYDILLNRFNGKPILGDA